MQLPDDIFEALGLEQPETVVETRYGFVYTNNVALPVFFDLKTNKDIEANLVGLAGQLASRFPFRDDIIQAKRTHATLLYIGRPTELHTAVESFLGIPVPDQDFLAAFEGLFDYCFGKASAQMEVSTTGLIPLAGGRALGIGLEVSDALGSFISKTRQLLEAAMANVGVANVRHLAARHKPLRHLYENKPHVTLLRSREPMKKFKRFEGIEIPKRIGFTHTHLQGVRRDYKVVTKPVE